jgi:hypothetical protein
LRYVPGHLERRSLAALRGAKTAGLGDEVRAGANDTQEHRVTTRDAVTECSGALAGGQRIAIFRLGTLARKKLLHNFDVTVMVLDMCGAFRSGFSYFI